MAYGETIKKMKIKMICPCNKPIEAREILGVVAYYHEDGSPCSSVNFLSSKSDKILSSYIASSAFDFKEKKNAAIICVSKSARKEVYSFLSGKLNEELAVSLESYIQLCLSMGNYYATDIISDELIKEITANFGEVFVYNARIVGGHTFSTTSVTLVKNVYPMQKLKAASVKSTIVNKSAIPKDKRLEDILDCF